MDCPTCHGTGEVDDNFLTDELVEQVFNEYYAIRGWHTAYGVESWEEYGHHVTVRNDTSARSCYSYEDVQIPIELFVRDETLRSQRIKEDFEKSQAEEKKKSEEEKQRKKERLRQQLEELERE